MGMKYYAYNFETNQTETTCAYYFFEKNIFGDIVGVYDEDGNKVLGFTYDAWGNFSITETSEISGLYEGYRTFLTKACIFRYRGYMYESSSELYYLQTRFYDPVVGRFINADDVGYLGASGDFASYNLFAYCSNNPVMRVDMSGTFSWEAAFAIGFCVALVGVAILAAVPTGGGSLVLAGYGTTYVAATFVGTSMAIAGIGIMAGALVDGAAQEGIFDAAADAKSKSEEKYVTLAPSISKEEEKSLCYIAATAV